LQAVTLLFVNLAVIVVKINHSFKTNIINHLRLLHTA